MSGESRDERSDSDINLLDYWRVLSKRKRLVIGLPLLAAFAVGFNCYFLATKIYESKASILAPKESTGGTGGLAVALAASGGAPFLGGLLPPGSSNRDAFVAILKSRTMAGELVDRFALQKYYDVEFREQAIDALQGYTEISVSKEGIITVKVEDKDPKLAADIANSYFAYLDRLFVRMTRTEAGTQRAFIADRLEKTEKALREAEEALRRFRDRNKAVVLDEQSKGAITATAQIRAEIAAAEVQLESMRTYATENNPNTVQQKIRIQELKRQLAQIQYGKGLDLPPEVASSGPGRQEMHVPFVKVPELAVELIRLTRDVKIQEGIFTLLTQQYEQAKIQEAKDTPTVQVLDVAVPAHRKSKPKTILSSAFAGGLVLFAVVFYSFFREYIERLRSRQKQDRSSSARAAAGSRGREGEELPA